MEEIKLRVDWYTKAVLTVIALALCWFSVKPLFTAREVMADIQGDLVTYSVYGDVKKALNAVQPIRVEVDNWP